MLQEENTTSLDTIIEQIDTAEYNQRHVINSLENASQELIEFNSPGLDKEIKRMLSAAKEAMSKIQEAKIQFEMARNTASADKV
ncbi:hypothetical protein [Portibacter marinus]|uniref:hypothetical protein n=1 Tax=Portibacter marinus TaxID=2898660 RepID=UPI001F1AA931|nr:hypothetical protein [Portibacter marinus]